MAMGTCLSGENASYMRWSEFRSSVRILLPSLVLVMLVVIVHERPNEVHAGARTLFRQP